PSGASRVEKPGGHHPPKVTRSGLHDEDRCRLHRRGPSARWRRALHPLAARGARRHGGVPAPAHPAVGGPGPDRAPGGLAPYADAAPPPPGALDDGRRATPAAAAAGGSVSRGGWALLLPGLRPAPPAAGAGGGDGARSVAPDAPGDALPAPAGVPLAGGA